MATRVVMEVLAAKTGYDTEMIEDDMELEFSAEFPWPLSHLSVLCVLWRVVAVVCAVRSWSISVARLTRLLTVTVVFRSELISMG